MVSVKESNIFSRVFIWQLDQERSFFDVLDRKERVKDKKTEVLKKFKKSYFFKRVSPWFLLKKWNILARVVFRQVK